MTQAVGVGRPGAGDPSAAGRAVEAAWAVVWDPVEALQDSAAAAAVLPVVQL